MSWFAGIVSVISAASAVGLFKSIEVLVGKWRPRTAVEDERSAKAFAEMKQVTEAYKDVVEVHKQAAADATEALAHVTAELLEARKEVHELRIEVAYLKRSLAGVRDVN